MCLYATQLVFSADSPRPVCSFAAKAATSKQAGAAAVVILNTVQGMYAAAMGLNESSMASLNFSSGYVTACDSDCSRGSRLLQASDTNRQSMLAGFPEHCPCGHCILATQADIGQPQRRICCTADDYLLMRGNASMPSSALVPAAFAPLSASRQIETAARQQQNAKFSWRSVYIVDPTSVFMWLLGIAVTAWSTWVSAREHRAAVTKHLALGTPSRASSIAMSSSARPEAQGLASPESTSARDATHSATAGDIDQTTQSRDSASVHHHDSVNAQKGASSSSIPADGASAAGSPGYAGQCSTGLVVGAFTISSILLLALFFMLRAGVPIVWLLIPLFAVGATSAQVRLVWLPLLAKLKHPLLNKHAGSVHRRLQAVTVRLVCAVLMGGIVVAVWLATRHTPAVFFFQNVLGALVCANLMMRLQLLEFRAIAALLMAFFVYDVFFVFLTPFLFGGSSVMVAVATAGQPEPVANPACYCRLNPTAAECGDGERMPILLTLPRVGWGGGEALLGLGDIVLPGLLISLAVRYDTEGFHGLWRGKYWLSCMVAYALGLAAANAAVVGTGQGQPALLYIVPCILLAFLVRAWQLGEVPLVWYGPIGTVPDAETVLLIAGDRHAPPPGAHASHAAAGPGACRPHAKSVQHDTLNPMVGGETGSPLHAASAIATTAYAASRVTREHEQVELASMDPVHGGKTTRGRRQQRPGSGPAGLGASTSAVTEDRHAEQVRLLP